MTSVPTNGGQGVKLALEMLTRRRSEVITRIPESESPPSLFYTFLKQTRRKYLLGYLDLLKDAIATGDTTDFLGNETFQSYSHAKNGFSLKEVLSIPTLVEKALVGLASDMAASGEATADAALSSSLIICDILGQAETIRAESFTQTRDEVVRFYHSFQEEIDRFPSNLAATLDFSTLMLSAVKKCEELTGAERCAFFARDLLTNDLHLEATDYEHDGLFAEPGIRLDESIMKQLVYQRSTVIVEGYSRGLPLASSIMRQLKTKLLVLVPLMVRSRNVGVMMLDNVARPRMFTSEIISLAERFANKVAGAMENAHLHGSEQQKLKETMALLEVSRLVTSTLDIEVLLSRLVQITADVCEVGKCSVYIFLEENERFYPTATFGMFPDSEWETELSEGIMPADLLSEEAAALAKHKAIVSDARISPFIPEARVDDTGVRSLLLVPIASREKLLGLMILFYETDRDDLESEDHNLVGAIAGQAAVAMENASLYEDLEMSYFSTVKALARAIEVKDPYTYGHSERVTEYAIAIAGKMRLEEWEMRNIKYAAALHDIGKLGIAMHILNKPGALSEEEFIHVKTHPQMGDSIIEPVSFLREPRSIILHHHERYDGKGYPDGIMGEEIPLGARILAVADAFEAMMSDRPYRKALALSEAVKEIKINSGTQFDPVIVAAFVSALEEGEVGAEVEAEAENKEESRVERGA
jgi:HD-GYP domain-containing protein (c-di-GMP phosphodiesterase class II)